MAAHVKLVGGLVINKPTLEEREHYFATDTGELHIGQESGVDYTFQGVYKSYVGILSQYDTDNPTGFSFHNDTGRTVSFTRNSVGDYNLIFSGDTIGEKLLLPNPISLNNGVTFGVSSGTLAFSDFGGIALTNTLEFFSVNPSNSKADNLIVACRIEIRIYN